MALVVEKFGGSSVSSNERINRVAKRVQRTKADGYDVVVVLSAMAGETNRLIELAKQIDGNPTLRELDMLMSTGEQQSNCIAEHGVESRWLPGKVLHW